MNSLPKYSVIIPCYNLGEFLDEAVHSVLAQTTQDFEILIVNDGSTDPKTVEKITSYDHPSIRVLHTPNRGLPAARNHGIEHAQGRYVACLDADDKYHAQFLKACGAILDEDTDGRIGFVSTHVQVFGERQYVWRCTDFAPYRLVSENLMQSACLFRRRCWEEIGGYNIHLSGYQDWNFWLSIVARGYRWETIKETLVYYRERAGSMVKTSDRNSARLKEQIHRLHERFITNHLHEIFREYDRKINAHQNQLATHERSVDSYLAEIAKLRKQVLERDELNRQSQSILAHLTGQCAALHREWIISQWRLLAVRFPNRRIRLYGAGKYSAWLLPLLHAIGEPKLADVLDDCATARVLEPGGYRPIPTATASVTPEDVLVLATDTHQMLMRRRLAALHFDSCTIVDLYENLPPGPYPKEKAVSETKPLRTSFPGKSARTRILFISHDASRTGAPMVLLHLIQWMKQHTDLSFEILLKQGGDLEPDFAALGPVTVWNGDASIFDRGDLVYSNTITNGHLLRSINGKNRPIISHIHEMEYWMTQKTEIGNNEAVLEKTTRFIAASRAVHRALQQTLNVPADRISVVHEFIPTTCENPFSPSSLTRLRRELGIPEDAFVVGGSGTTDWRKGPDLFIQTALALKRHCERLAFFLWVGGENCGCEYEALRYDLTRAGLADVVKFIGRVPDSRRYFNLFDAFAMVSREDPFPLVCLETAAMGKPILCFDRAGGIQEFIEQDAGIVVPYLDTDAMAEGLSRLIRAPDFAQQLGVRAREKVRIRHDVESGAPQIVEIVSRLLKE